MYSVVERRQQIGMLRALGLQKGQVRLAFLLESSFIALLGIGVALGGALSGGIIDAMSEDFAGVTYTVHYVAIALVVVLSYAASLLTTYLPEALRRSTPPRPCAMNNPRIASTRGYAIGVSPLPRRVASAGYRSATYREERAIVRAHLGRQVPAYEQGLQAFRFRVWFREG